MFARAADRPGLRTGHSRRTLPRACRCEVNFQGELRPEQKAAADAMLAHDTGVLAATTAFGKTVVAAWLIAQRGVNTLVLVHRRQLLDQWVERLSTFLACRRSRSAASAAGEASRPGCSMWRVIQSLVRKGVVDDRVAEYGHVIVDECHHLSAHSFEQVVRRAKARFVLGLSATVTRKDGHHPIIFMQCGRCGIASTRRPRRRRVPSSTPSRAPDSLSAGQRAGSGQTGRVPGAVSATGRRRGAQSAHLRGRRRVRPDGRSPLVLTERNEHLDRLEQLSGSVRHLVVLARREWARSSGRPSPTGWQPSRADEARVILATGKYIGEGFDDPRLDTLFLTLPVSWRGTIAQYAGRLHRLYDGKREVRVYDYADLNVPMLARMFDRRCRGYEAVGYTILLPASAIPGWPADVRCRRIRSGSATTRPACGGSFGTASIRRWRICSCTPLGRCRRKPKAPIARAARRRLFSIGAWKPCRRQRAFRAERRAADRVRWLRDVGSRSPVR